MAQVEKANIILASQSESRKRQLTEAGIVFEVMVSHADETPDNTKSFGAQLAEIALRKALTIQNQTAVRGPRVIVAADMNVVFGGKMYGKPKTIEEARSLIKSMQGSSEIYGYTGNAILLSDKDRVLEMINVTDIARMSMDHIPDTTLEDYLANQKPLTKCGGFTIMDAPFVHLEEGRYSTACGLTTEYVEEMIKGLLNIM